MVKSRKKAKKMKIAVKNKAKPKIKKMARSELNIFKKLLLIEREKVGGGLSHIAETTLNKSQREASGDLSGYSYHMADMASDDYEREFSLGRATDEQKILYSIDEAMKRIADGTYGSCLQCGKSIPKKRLKVLPHAELCIDCKKARETK
jgi:DnaK suppressor protein